MRGTSTQRQIVTHIREVLGVFRGPIIVYHEGWGETLPDWLKHRIKIERLLQMFARREDRATPAEAVAYLYTASLTRPLNGDWTDIYCHLGGRYASWQGGAMPEGLAPAALTTCQERMLDQLLQWLRSQSARQERSISSASPRIVQAYHEQLHLF